MAFKRWAISFHAETGTIEMKQRPPFALSAAPLLARMSLLRLLLVGLVAMAAGVIAIVPGPAIGKRSTIASADPATVAMQHQSFPFGEVTRTWVQPALIPGSRLATMPGPRLGSNMCVENIHGGWVMGDDGQPTRVEGLYPGRCDSFGPDDPSPVAQACRAQGSMICDGRWIGTGAAFVVDGQCTVSTPGHFFMNESGGWHSIGGCSFRSAFIDTTIDYNSPEHPEPVGDFNCDPIEEWMTYRQQRLADQLLFSGTLEEARNGQNRVTYLAGFTVEHFFSVGSGPQALLSSARDHARFMISDRSVCQRLGALDVSTAEASRTRLEDCTQGVAVVGAFDWVKYFRVFPPSSFPLLYPGTNGRGALPMSGGVAHQAPTTPGTSGFVHYCLRRSPLPPIPILMGVAMYIPGVGAEAVPRLTRTQLLKAVDGSFSVGVRPY